MEEISGSWEGVGSYTITVRKPKLKKPKYPQICATCRYFRYIKTCRGVLELEDGTGLGYCDYYTAIVPATLRCPKYKPKEGERHGKDKSKR